MLRVDDLGTDIFIYSPVVLNMLCCPIQISKPKQERNIENGPLKPILISDIVPYFRTEHLKQNKLRK